MKRNKACEKGKGGEPRNEKIAPPRCDTIQLKRSDGSDKSGVCTGCPYKSADHKTLLDLLRETGLSDEETLNCIANEAKKKGNYTSACSMHFIAKYRKGETIESGTKIFPFYSRTKVPPQQNKHQLITAHGSLSIALQKLCLHLTRL